PDIPEKSQFGTGKPIYFPVRFAENDARIAGAITPKGFFRRYSTTNLNRSRGRAAALFRIFLWVDLRAVVEPKPGEEEELLQKAFPPGFPRGEGHPSFFDEDQHGKDPACMACHYKLDPMGRTFFPIGTVLADMPGAGALVFKRADGSLVNIP